MSKDIGSTVRLSVLAADRDKLDEVLIDEHGRLRDSVALGHEIIAVPLFTSIETKKAIGAADVLSFMLSVPTGVAAGVVANAVYSWLTRVGSSKARIEGVEILDIDDHDGTVHLIVKILTKE